MNSAVAKLPKKHKKSIFDDDDFFVMKKSKKLKAVEVPKIEKQASNEASLRLHSPRLASLTDQTTPEDDLQQFFSADDLIDEQVVSNTASPLSPAKRCRTRSHQSPLHSTTIDNLDADMDDDPDLKEFFSNISTDKNNERTRIYKVKVISKFEPFYEEEMEINGNCAFSKLLKDLLTRTFRAYKKRAYWKNGALVWVEGRSELKPFFKPSTLRINPPTDGSATQLTCLFIPESDISGFESKYPEFDLDKEPSEVETSVIEINDESDASEPAPPEEQKAGVNDYFVIGLKGRDNKRIEVEVNARTPIQKLLEYYIQQKGIDISPESNARLVFDSEELPLDGTVGDTELEEDFEVEVYL